MTRRHLLPAAALAIALAASGGVAVASAAPPPSDPPASEEVPSPVAEEVDPSTGEVVQSWALMPGGSLDPDEAGNRPELSYQSAPGETIEDSVLLANYSNVDLTFRVYGTDAFNNDTGAFDALAGDQTPRDIGSWITVAQELVTVPAGRQAQIPITIAVPLDARPGDHAGAVLASNQAVGGNDSGQVITLDRRTGTRVYLRVDGPLTPELAVTDLRTDLSQGLNPLGGTGEVTFRVENRGNVRLGGTAAVSIAGPFGLGRRTLEGAFTIAGNRVQLIPELLPGEDVTLTARVEDVPALFLDRTTVTVTPSSSGEADIAPEASASDLVFAPPIAVLLVLLATLLVILGSRRLRRHARAGGTGPEAAPGSDAPASEVTPERQPA